MSYYTTNSHTFQCENMNNREKSPNSIVLVPFGDFFYSLSKHNRYLRSVLQRVDQAVIVIDGEAFKDRSFSTFRTQVVLFYEN